MSSTRPIAASRPARAEILTSLQQALARIFTRKFVSAGTALALVFGLALAGSAAGVRAETPLDLSIEGLEGDGLESGAPGLAEQDRLEPSGEAESEPALPPSTAGKKNRSDIVKEETDVRAERRKRLEELYDSLGMARDAIEAEPIVEAIEETWQRSGSDTIDLLMARAGAFVREADVDMAVKILDAVVDLAPDEAEAWHQRAILYCLRQDYQRCLSDLRRALSLDPRHYKAIIALGVVLQEFGDKKGALEAYRKALQVNPYVDSARQSVEELSREVEGQDI